MFHRFQQHHCICLYLFQTKGGLAALHIAVAIPGIEGVRMTELLLNSLADPDVRATEDDAFLNRSLVRKGGPW